MSHLNGDLVTPSLPSNVSRRGRCAAFQAMSPEGDVALLSKQCLQRVVLYSSCSILLSNATSRSGDIAENLNGDLGEGDVALLSKQCLQRVVLYSSCSILLSKATSRSGDIAENLKNNACKFLVYRHWLLLLYFNY